jgi:hypothetical protein
VGGVRLLGSARIASRDHLIGAILVVLPFSEGPGR